MGPPQSSAEKWLQVLTSVLTNATMLPTFFLVLRRQRMDAAVVGLLTMSSSTIYHTLDTLGGTLLSMDAVQVRSVAAHAVQCDPPPALPHSGTSLTTSVP